MFRFKTWNIVVGWVVFAIATICYLLTMEPTASLWDCSEFIATSYKLEVGHPPGAPLFMMLARLASMLALEPASVPVMINAMNCVASGFCILFLFWTITHLVRRISVSGDEPISLHKGIAILGSGAVGALAYAFTDTFWFSAVEGEVYALSSMFTALVVWLMLKWEENADKPTAPRWIVLIAYLMGLSIGVHILNLLTIPALVMIYFFRKVRYTSLPIYLAKMAGALVVSMLILGFINGIIIPYTVAIGAWFDTIAVNSLGMPVNSGMLLFVALLFVGLAAVIALTHYFALRRLNIVAMALMAILIGFSSYASVTIRANANPPMNSNNPSTPHTLLSMLNRDQYGSRPLLYGPYYTAIPMPLYEYTYNQKGAVPNPKTDSDDYTPTGDFDSEVMWWLNPQSGKYEKRTVFKGYAYDFDKQHLFPRMWYLSRDYSPYTDLEVGRGERKISGAYEWYEPTAAENIDFFMKYQMGDMFWRYFMWNFVGRQDDGELAVDQERGVYKSGGWLSGIPFIDKLVCGLQEDLPSDMAQNKGRNTYFFLPLLLGFVGLLYQLRRDWKGFFVVLLLFVMMGIALVVYFNTAPGEPRERDYVYAGAFYAFCIWLGVGALAIARSMDDLWAWVSGRLLKRDYSPMAKSVVAGVAIFVSLQVPVVLATENWDDHDRSGRFVARDIGWNYLTTVAPNAILINFGDNDTFPVWYCQEVESVRPDVRVMNSSYLAGEWYIDEMKLAANKAAGVPFTIPASKYSYTSEWFPVANIIDVLDDAEARELGLKKRYIENRRRYAIEFLNPKTNQTKTMLLSYNDCYDWVAAANKNIDRLTAKLNALEGEYAMAEQQRNMGRLNKLQDEYTTTYSDYEYWVALYNAIVANATFQSDAAEVDRYWDYADERGLKLPISLKDVIRLFVSDKPMLLASDGAVLRLFAEDEPVADGFSKIGMLNPTMDSYLDGKQSDYILGADRYFIDVDAESALEAGIITEAELPKVVDRVELSVDSYAVSKDHLMMLDLLANFDWKRPIHFTQRYIMSEYGIGGYNRFDGYSYSFVPFKGDNIADIDMLYEQFMGTAKGAVRGSLRFGNIADEDVYADYFSRYNFSAAQFSRHFTRVADAFVLRGSADDLTKAERLLDRGLAMLPPRKLGYNHSDVMSYLNSYYSIANVLATLPVENGETGDDLQSTAMDAATRESAIVRLRLKADRLAAQYIHNRAEYVDYFIRTIEEDTPSEALSMDLYNYMHDIYDVLIKAAADSDSFPILVTPNRQITGVEQASFDKLMNQYLATLNRITPADIKKQYKLYKAGNIDSLPYICALDDNGREVYSHINLLLRIAQLPAERVGKNGVVRTAPYLKAMQRYIERFGDADLVQQFNSISGSALTLPGGTVAVPASEVAKYKVLNDEYAPEVVELQEMYEEALATLKMSSMLLKEGVDILSKELGVSNNVKYVDEFQYFYELSEIAASLDAQAAARGLSRDASRVKFASSDVYYDSAERMFNNADVYAINNIAKYAAKVSKGIDGVKSGSVDAASSVDFGRQMANIIGMLRFSQQIGGSFEWVANPDGQNRVSGQVSFDDLMVRYIEAVDSLTPRSVESEDMPHMAIHIMNLFDVFNVIPSGRGSSPSAPYSAALERYLRRAEVYAILEVVYNDQK